MNAISKVNTIIPIRIYITRVTFCQEIWGIRAFEKWITNTTGDTLTRSLDHVSRMSIPDDILDSQELKAEEKRSLLRFLIYIFPYSTTATNAETGALLTVLEENPSRRERGSASEPPRRYTSETRKLGRPVRQLTCCYPYTTGQRVEEVNAKWQSQQRDINLPIFPIYPDNDRRLLVCTPIPPFQQLSKNLS